MAGVWDWLTGREAARQAADAEASQKVRQAAQEAQDAVLAREAAQYRRNNPEPIQRSENAPRPGERMMPEQVQKMRAMHDTPPEPQKTDPDPREATRMEYTVTPQAAPSFGGNGTRWVNTRSQQSAPVADSLVDESRAAIGREDEPQITAAEAMRRAEAANPTPVHEQYQPPESTMAAWRKHMTPEERAELDEARRQTQKQGQSQDQGPSLTQKQDP